VTTTDPAARTDAAKILRALADLIDAEPGIRLPDTSISFYLNGENAAATMAAIAAALPCEWRAGISHSSGSDYEWLDVRSGPDYVGPGGGIQVRISAPTADVCAPAGTQTRTVTLWRPAAALTGLVGTEPLREVA
jgi:hypothetical protein